MFAFPIAYYVLLHRKEKARGLGWADRAGPSPATPTWLLADKVYLIIVIPR